MKFRAARVGIFGAAGLILAVTAGCQRQVEPAASLASAEPASSSSSSRPAELTEKDIRRLSEIFKPAQEARDAYLALIQVREHFTLYKVERPLNPLTTHLARAVAQALTQLPSAMGEELRKDLRRDFSDGDLELLEKLGEAIRAAAEKTQAAAFAAMDAEPALLAKAAQYPQFAFLKVIRVTHGQPVKQVASAIENEIRRLSRLAPRSPGDVSTPFSDDLLGGPASAEGDVFHPWSVLSLLPRRGEEGRRVPLGAVRAGMARLFAEVRGFSDAGNFSRQAARYRELRNQDDPANPYRQYAGKDVVSIAILGSGVDYVEDPALGRFLAPNADTGFGSRDFSDGRGAPWAPWSESSFRTGTYVAGVFWAALGKLDAGGVGAGGYRYAVWKTSSLRRLVPAAEPPSRERTVMAEALVRAIDAGPAGQPRILLVSEPASGLYEILKSAGRVNTLRDAPWLWVMAAGDGFADAEDAEPAPCLVEFAAEERPAKRLLCVGSVDFNDKGQVRIAAYSNRGERVDVYSVVRYAKDRRVGTGFSAPVIAAAAAWLLREFPALSAEQLKEIIVGSASSYEGGDGAPPVKVWDPEDAQTLSRARVLAEKSLKNK